MKKLRRLPRLSLGNYTLLAVLLAAGGLLTFRLVSLLPGLSTYEKALPGVRDTLTTIWNLPVNLPLELARGLVAVATTEVGIGTSRLPNVLLALLLAFMTYWLLKRWYGYRLALFGMLLMLTAPWFLHVGRLASTDIVFPLGMMTVLCLAALWHNPKQGRALLYASAFATTILFYIPGMIWLLLGLVYFERRNIYKQLKVSRLHTALASLLGAVLLVPLAHSLLLHWQNIRLFLGIPATMPSALDVALEFGRTWQHAFLGGWHNPVYNLGGLPLLALVVSALFAVGVYLHAIHPKATRTQFHLYVWLIGTLLIALGTASYSLILPIVIIMAVGGVGYLLHLWLRIFPKNPLARSFGIGLMVAVLLFTVAYNLRNYYIAWPGAPATKAAFERQL